MRKLGFIFIVVCSGCFDFCKPESCPDHATSGGCSAPNCDCPLTSQLPGKNGTSCRGSKASTCSADDLDCVCDPGSLVWHCSRPDFATPALDLARPRDLAHKLSCIGYRDCLDDCYTTDPYPSATQCEGRCKPAAQLASVIRYDAAMACGVIHCLADVDAGSGRCRLASDGVTLLNEDGSLVAPSDPGSGQKRCDLCVADTHAALHGDPCSSLSSPDCNPAECEALVTACLFD